MRLITLHSDFIEFEPKKKALKDAEDVEKRKTKVEECLVVFCAVEKGDENNLEQVTKNFIRAIDDVAKQVKTKKIVIYPWVHLSSSPASPNSGLKVLKDAEVLLKKKYDVTRAPFGYYKEFNIKVKGHPLAELSREISGEKITREKIVEKVKKNHLILTPEGKEIKVDLKNLDKIKDFLNKHPSLKDYIYAEEIKGMPSKEPPSIKAMQKLELVGYATASDPGNFNLFPKGHLIFELLKEWAYEIAVKRFGAMQIDTPILYDWSQPDIRAQGESFQEKHYSVTVPDRKKELVLRFAGDFGLFRIMRDAILSYKHLPLRIYEFSKSFRYETRGELSGLKRLRAFHMPDIHSFCADSKQGWKEYSELYKSYDDLAKGTGIEYAVVFRIVEDFYKKYKKEIVNLLKYSKKPAFIELLSEMKHYWAVKHEFQGIDSVAGNSQLATVQLDVKDATIYGITYTDKNNKEQGCIICHSSIGSIERWFYSILEHALKNKIPLLPLWLSPMQVRICPMSDEYNKHAQQLAEKLEKNQIRVDIDDRNDTIGKKIRDAELEWCPFIVTVGAKEVESKELAVRVRELGKIKQMKTEQLVKEIKSKTEGKPFKQLPLPKLLSQRPVFVG